MTRALFAALAVLVAAPHAFADGPAPERSMTFGTTADIQVMAVSRDGGRLAYADSKGVLHILSLPGGEELASGSTGEDHVTDGKLLFSPDGSKVALMFQDGLKFFDARTAKVIAKTAVPPGVQLGRVEETFKFASSGPDVYELATGKKLVSINNGNRGLVLAPGGSLAASTKVTGPTYRRSDGLMGVPTASVVYELPGGRELWSQDEAQDGLAGFAFSPDGKTLVKLYAAYNNSKAVFVDARSGSQLGEASRDLVYVQFPVYSPDGSVFVMTEGGGALGLFAPPASEKAKISPKDGYVTGNPSVAAFSPDSRTLYAGMGWSSIRRFNVSDGSSDGYVGQGGILKALALSPDGKTLAAAFTDTGVVLVDFATGKIKRQLPKQVNVQRLTWSPDGRLLASGSLSENTKLFDAEGKVVYDLPAQNAKTLEFSPDGKRLLVGSDGIKTSLYNMDTGELIKSLETAGDLGVLTPDGKRAVMASMDNIVMWNPATGVTVRDFSGLPNQAASLAISPDGKLLAACDNRGTVGIWELGSAKLVRTIKADDYPAELLKFVDGGRKLLLVPSAHPVLLDVATGEKLPFPDLERSGCPALGPGDHVLLTCGYRDVSVWRLSGEPEKPAVAGGASAPARKKVAGKKRAR